MNRSVAACVDRQSTATATAIWLQIAVAVENRCRVWARPTIVKARDSSLFQIAHETHAVEVEIDAYHGYISMIFIRTIYWYFSCLFFLFSLNCSRKKRQILKKYILLRRKNKTRDRSIFKLVRYLKFNSESLRANAVSLDAKATSTWKFN